MRAVRASADGGGRLGLLLLDVDELGLAAGEAHLDAPGTCELSDSATSLRRSSSRSWSDDSSACASRCPAS